MQIGSVTISTKGRLRLTFSSGQNDFFSSYALHQRSSPVSTLFADARFRSNEGA